MTPKMTFLKKSSIFGILGRTGTRRTILTEKPATRKGGRSNSQVINYENVIFFYTSS